MLYWIKKILELYNAIIFGQQSLLMPVEISASVSGKCFTIATI